MQDAVKYFDQMDNKVAKAIANQSTDGGTDFAYRRKGKKNDSEESQADHISDESVNIQGMYTEKGLI